MKFTISIDMGNAAFDNNNQINEVQRILRKISEQIDVYNRLAKDQQATIIDINGNTVGFWKVR